MNHIKGRPQDDPQDYLNDSQKHGRGFSHGMNHIKGRQQDHP